MRILYKRGAKTAEIPVFGPCTLKIYQVPAAYSEDGMFAALQNPGELEPVPACAHADTLLLAHVELATDENGALALKKHHVIGEVSYAAN